MTPLTPSVTQQIQQLSITRGTYNVVFIGAGNINFGSDEGPWSQSPSPGPSALDEGPERLRRTTGSDHSVRLEHKLQTRMNVVGIIDPALDRAGIVLDAKRASFVEKAYKNARLCRDLAEFVAGLKPDEKPHAFIVGSPAQFHGSVQSVSLLFFRAGRTAGLRTR